MIAAGAFRREDGERALAEGTLDAVVFGRLFIANPDLPQRFALRTPLQAADPSTFYTPGAHGYIDYPALAG
jgi:N-ethylmaleimide reductase